MPKKKKSKINFKDRKVIACFVLVFVAVAAVAIFISKPSITGEVKYSGGTYSCTINSRTYDRCMWVYLGSGETRITNVPWASKTITGAAGYIRDYVPGANVNPQVNAWIDLTDWLNNKIYDSTPDAFKNLQWYAKSDGTTTILVAWNYKVSESYWPGWKWIDVKYDYYYEDNARNMKGPYASSSAGFYYNPDTNEVSH